MTENLEGGSGLEGGPTCLHNIYHGNSSHSESSDAHVVEVVEVMRIEGNELFIAQNWDGAESRYSECINRANDILKSNTMKVDLYTVMDLQRVVMLAYSNRAETRLRLQSYEDAWRDADSALQINPRHVKTLVRKGKAAHGLGHFSNSCKMFQTALELSPREHAQSISEYLEASMTAAYEQSLTINDLSKGHLCNLGDEPSSPDFVGPAEIRRVSYGCGRRGLFATRGVEAGKVLLMSNPLAIVRMNTGRNTKALIITSLIHDRVVKEVANAVTGSKRRIAQLSSLASHGQETMEIPSMQLFRPGSWAPPAGPEEIDIDDIGEIVRMNAFGNDEDSLVNLEVGMAKSDHARGETVCGIWILPSFANHSCAPTGVHSFIGDIVVIRAGRDLKAGEEITISYFENLFESVDTRQAAAKNWFFTCQCERCVFEETLDPQFSKISKALPRLVEAARAEGCEEKRKRRAARKLAAVADEVEAVINSNSHVKFGRQKLGWIRAPFLEAYHSKNNLQASKMKEMNEMNEHNIKTTLSTWMDIMESLNSVEGRRAHLPVLDSHSVLLYRETPDS